jgi:cyanophycinase
MPSNGKNGNGKHSNGKNGNGKHTTRGPRDGRLRRVREFKARPVRPGDPGLPAKGRLLIIGGHEDKVGNMVILRALARLVGSGKLVVATLASEEPGEQWERYESVLRGLGIRHLHHLQVQSRADAESPRAMGILEGATGVFFTGGDQLRLTSLIGDTPVFSRCYEMFAHGGVIAGTSAGAAVMSETMIVGGNGESSPRIDDGLHLAPGFGFAKDMVIDQHFSERGRVGRLLSVIAQNPRILGIGIDENTAIEMEPFRRFRVVGAGSAYVIDGSNISDTSVAADMRGRPVSVFGVQMHVLTQGDEYDIVHRIPGRRPAEEVDEELGVDTKEDAEQSADRATAAAK